jgi:hypothetical protein
MWETDHCLNSTPFLAHGPECLSRDKAKRRACNTAHPITEIKRATNIVYALNNHVNSTNSRNFNLKHMCTTGRSAIDGDMADYVQETGHICCNTSRYGVTTEITSTGVPKRSTWGSLRHSPTLRFGRTVTWG